MIVQAAIELRRILRFLISTLVVNIYASFTRAPRSLCIQLPRSFSRPLSWDQFAQVSGSFCRSIAIADRFSNTLPLLKFPKLPIEVFGEPSLRHIPQSY